MLDSFVHLHVHTQYSLLDGVGRIEELILKAKSMGMQSLAITDHEVMYGVVPFYQACKRHGIHPIIGCEINIRTQNDLSIKHQKAAHLVLLAENSIGYRNLLKLTTQAQMNGKGQIDREILSQYTTGLIATSACLRGEIPQAILDERVQDVHDLIHFYLTLFGRDHFFFELQNPLSEAQQKVNQQLIKLAGQYQVALVATNDVHYVHREDEFLHRCLICIKAGEKLEDWAHRPTLTAEQELKSPQEMQQIFEHVPEALSNTVRIAERCQVEIPLTKRMLPQYPTPPKISAKQLLHQKCLTGIKFRYGTSTAVIEERLAYELAVIDQMGYNDYFLVVWDVVRFARSKQIAVGPGRGSAAGSLVAYLLQITDVDPIQYELLFERFLNPERVNLPDIDLDFNDERRDEVMGYVRQKYSDHMAQILTFGTMAPRAAIRDVGRVLGISVQEVDKIAKLIPRQPGMTLEKAFQLEPRLKKWANKNEIKQLFQIVAKLEGLPRHISTHAAGVVLSRSPLVEDVPLQQGNEGIPLTQYTMDHLEAIGLCKMDLLGLRNLTVIERAASLIKQKTGEMVRYHQQDKRDLSTYQLLAAGETIGVFQLESTGIRQVLQEVKPATFEDIVAVIALYRPGPMEQIPRFVQAKHKQTPIEIPHPDLTPILAKTYGIIVYQEQIMQIAEKMAGFSLGQADLLRRAIAKKQKKLLDDRRKSFVDGCIQNGYGAQVGHQLYDYIVHFADYGFNRSHAVAYSELAYQTAYLKANYPFIFMTALLSTVTDQSTKLATYIKEAQQMGIEIKLPDIGQSECTFTLEQDAIRFGFSAIKHVSKAAVQEIICQRRAEGKFRDIFDLCRRVDHKICNRSTLEALIKSGAMDALPDNRNQKRAILHEEYEHHRSVPKNQTSLFAQSDTERLSNYAHLADDSPQKKLAEEYEYLGVYLSAHPFDQYARQIRPFMTSQIDQIASQGKQQVYLAGLLQKIKPIRTKQGKQMAFIAIEDQTGKIEAILFPKTFHRFVPKLQVGQPVIIQGELQHGDSLHMIVQDVAQLRVVSLLIDEKHEKTSILTQLKQILRKYRGLIPVQLIYQRNRQGVALPINKYGIKPQADCLQQIEKLLGTGKIK